MALTLERASDHREVLLRAIRGCLGIIGNVDHNTGHGWNAARMRGTMLIAIRDILNTAVMLEDIEENK